MSTQLWKLLIRIRKPEENETLTCLECFAIIDLLLEGARLGIELERLKEIACRHLSQCPECYQQLWNRLDHLSRLVG